MVKVFAFYCLTYDYQTSEKVYNLNTQTSFLFSVLSDLFLCRFKLILFFKTGKKVLAPKFFTSKHFLEIKI